LDLETAALRRSKGDGKDLSDFDIVWDNDAGGVLMALPNSPTLVFPLFGAGNQEDAILTARLIRSLSRSVPSGHVSANDNRFAAVVTGNDNLVVVEIIDYSPHEATLQWWLEEATVPAFSDASTVVLRVASGTREFGQDSLGVDFDTRAIVKTTSPVLDVQTGPQPQWAPTGGIDALPMSNVLLGFEMTTEVLQGRPWESIMPADLRAVALKTPQKGAIAALSTHGAREQPVIAFRTLQGGLGIVQVLSLRDKDGKAKFRYSMLRYMPVKHSPAVARRRSAHELKKIGLGLM
jgi:hypothetical protein